MQLLGIGGKDQVQQVPTRGMFEMDDPFLEEMQGLLKGNIRGAMGRPVSIKNKRGQTVATRHSLRDALALGSLGRQLFGPMGAGGTTTAESGLPGALNDAIAKVTELGLQESDPKKTGALSGIDKLGGPYRAPQPNRLQGMLNPDWTGDPGEFKYKY